MRNRGQRRKDLRREGLQDSGGETGERAGPSPHEPYRRIRRQWRKDWGSPVRKWRV